MVSTARLAAAALAALSVGTTARAEPPRTETEIFDALVAHLEAHAETTAAGLAPDGTPLPPVCEEFGHTVCVAEAFLSEHDTGRAIAADAALADAGRAVIDVRGAGERELVPIGDAAEHAVLFGHDVWDPTTVGELEREMFAEEMLETVGQRDASLALLCMAGVRSRAAAMALREAGFTDVVNIADGVIGSPAGPGMAAALGID